MKRTNPMIFEKQLLALYGLKWNPFLSDIPVEAVWTPPQLDSFSFRMEGLVMEGGFAMISGDPGLGKSKVLQLTAHRLSRLADVVVGVMERPQSSLQDFYREMSALFGVNLSPANRYGGFKALRQRWQNHIRTTLFRPVLLIDEAQEMVASSLNELRLLASTQFDSQCILTILLCGDSRLPQRFRTDALVSLGTRIRVRLPLEPLNRDHLLAYLNHALEQAGAPHLMTDALMEALADHCCGNLRMLNQMAADLLANAAQKQLPRIDEKLFLETFTRQPRPRKPRPIQKDAMDG
jgi:type II secretory pathway predicted ATPase ExeA